MKNTIKFLGIIALVAIIGFSMTACSNGSTGGRVGGGGNTATDSSITYTGKSTDGSTSYSLKITENTGRAVYTPKKGDSYELTVSGKKSTGSVETFSGGVFTLKPSNNSGTTFKASISGSDLTDISGTITWTDKQTTAVTGKDSNFITVSGTFNFTGRTEDVRIDLTTKADNWEDRQELGTTYILNAGNNTPWSIMIQSQSVDTSVTFSIYGFDGPMTYIFGDELFFLYYHPESDLKIRNVNKPGVALNLITLSGTIEVNYDRKPVPYVKIHAFNKDYENYGYKWWEPVAWIADTELQSPPVDSNVPWSIVIPAFAIDTNIILAVQGRRDRNDGDDKLLFDVPYTDDVRIVKNVNITGIKFELGDMKR
jgi:hypothetical protein